MGNAANLFYGQGGDRTSLHSRITPSAEQRQFLQDNWNDLADYLKSRLSELSGYPVSTWIQGSYKFGTLIKPLSKGEQYDVDLGVYFSWSKTEGATPGPVQLKSWAQTALEEYLDECAEAKSVDTPPKERCARIVYAEQFHIDVPAYHFDADTDERRLATESNGWEDSDPKKVYVWFKEKVENPERDQLRRLIRYFKAWSVIAFDESPAARASSILLTVVASDAYVSGGVGDSNLDDEDAFCLVAETMLKRLQDDSRVPNPVNEDENLNRIPADEFEKFLEKLQNLVDVGERAAQCEDVAGAALAWADAFSYVFPLPDTEAVEVVDVASRTAVMQIPNIQIDVTDSDSRRHLGTYQNELPSVMRKCELKFTIVNPEVIPAFATIEWTVRNEGQEAERIGDLGHRLVTARMLTNTEHTAYAGRHFMDCVVKQHGVVFAVRRIVVKVRNQTLPPRNPPQRPAYTRLKSFRRR